MRKNLGLYLFSAVMLAACTGDMRFKDKLPLSSGVVVSFAGWTTIKAVGSITPVPQASDISSVGASVTLSWAEIIPDSGAVSSYNIYRATSAGVDEHITPLATGISATSRTYTDTSVAGGSTYYYMVVPVISGEVASLADAGDKIIKVIVPPANMVLIHRWAANKLVCEEMGKTPDRDHDYRCAVATGVNAPPGTGGSGYVDQGHSLFIDMFEQGCNYTYDSLANKCSSANGCVGKANSPSGSVTGTGGDVYYSRRTLGCYINTNVGSGVSWSSANATTTANRRTMGSAAPGLAPFVLVSQTDASEVCSGQTIPGFAGTKRLLKRKEFVIAAAWDSSLSDTTIDTTENGFDLDTTFNCNMNKAHPQTSATTNISATHPTIAFDNNTLPTAKDTLPACRNGDCSSSASASRNLRTGSALTASCVSRFGAHDLVGNVWEWTSDQIDCNGTTCTGVSGASNSADPANDDFSGLAFDGTQGPVANSSFSSSGLVQLPVGMPIASGTYAGDGVNSFTAANLHGDYFSINVTGGTKGAVNGQSPSAAPDGTGGGRFSVAVNNAPTTTSTGFGFRCAFDAD